MVYFIIVAGVTVYTGLNTKEEELIFVTCISKLTLLNNMVF